jgi:WD40 repeat protein
MRQGFRLAVFGAALRLAVAMTLGAAVTFAVTGCSAGDGLNGRITLKSDGPLITDAAFSPDGATVATAEGGGVVRLWNVATHKALGQINDPDAAVPGGAGKPMAIAFSPDGRLMATTTLGYADAVVHVWDVSTHKDVVAPIHTQGAGQPMVFSPDASILAMPLEHGIVGLWQVSDGQRVGELGEPPVAGTDVSVSDLAFGPDGRTLAISSVIGATSPSDFRGQVDVWSVAMRTRVAQPLPPTSTGDDAEASTYGLAFSPDGTILVGYQTNTLTRWAVPGGQRLNDPLVIGVRVQYQDANYVADVAFSPDGKTIVTVTHDGNVRHFAIGGQRVIGTVQAAAADSLEFRLSPNGKYLVGYPGGGRTNLQQPDAYLWPVSG